MNEVGEEAFECGFLVGHEDFRMIVLSDIVVTFPHRSVQEFFGAFYCSLVLGSVDEESINSGKLLLLQDHIFFHFCVWLTSADNKLLDFPNRPEASDRLRRVVFDVFDHVLFDFIDIGRSYPAIRVDFAYLRNDTTVLQFLRQTIAQCQNVKHLHVDINKSLDLI